MVGAAMFSSPCKGQANSTAQFPPVLLRVRKIRLYPKGFCFAARKKVYAVDPLLCPRYGLVIKILALVYEKNDDFPSHI
jgi:hypothetical protein